MGGGAGQEPLTQSKQLCDTLLGQDPPFEKHWYTGYLTSPVQKNLKQTNKMFEHSLPSHFYFAATGPREV